MLIRYGKDKDGRPVQKAVVYTKDEHKIPREKIDLDAIRVVERLKDSGFAAYVVGGAVRDLIVGNSPKDFDIVTNATPSKIKRIFRNARIIGRRFRLVHVVFGQKIFEVSTFRSTAEGSTGNNFGSMDEDVMRRDFTMNALYYDPVQEHVVDYVGGFRDIKKGVLRPVIPLERIFEEDPVRMLRAAKYSATTHCKMSWQIRHRIKKSGHLLSPVSHSRLTEEMLKIVNSSHAQRIVREALDCGLYEYLQNAAASLLERDKEFERAYMKSLSDLDEFCLSQKDSRLGKKLYFLIRDFLKTLCDWDAEIQKKTPPQDLYALSWSECRAFVLPMNPPRTELEYAVRAALRDFGVSVKRAGKKPNRRDAKSGADKKAE